MPKEHKKRGRREEKKRKIQNEEQILANKRQKWEALNDNEIIGNGNNQDWATSDRNPVALPGEIPFYGLLDEDEQEYFKRADSILELNQFTNDEERSLFLSSVYKEARGKELKMANDQSCSKLMERLILMSTSDQLKALFRKFSGHFLSLSQHRFASHCCECLFLQAAPIVTQELTAPLHEQLQGGDGEVFVSMENLFLYTLNEFEGNLSYLMTDPFASHTLRVLLLIFSGLPLSGTTTSTLYQSKKKETVSVFAQESSINESKMLKRTVPESFRDAIDKTISTFVAGLDVTYSRALATHPIGNPVLQLLLELELSDRTKPKARYSDSLLRKLIPEEQDDELTDTSSFINGLAYDAVGSRLLEVIIKYAPGKTFRTLYKSIFRDRIQIFAENDVASFVVIKILDRLSKEDLRYAVSQLCPQFSSIVERSRTSIIKVLIERCREREVETDLICDALQEAYGSNPSHLVTNMLKLNVDNTEGMAEDRKRRLQTQDSARVHGSLLAQSMLDASGALRELITKGLLELETSTLLSMSKDRSSSRVLQSSLVCTGQTLQFRRILVQRFFGHMFDLATDSIASHVVDSFWIATAGIAFIRERVALELVENETQLRESFSGRVIWKNWKLDMYKAKRREWMFEAKLAEGDSKSGIELARARFANTQKGVKRKDMANTGSKRRIQTGANDIAVGT